MLGLEVQDDKTRQQKIERVRIEKENFKYFAVLIGSMVLSFLLVWGPYATVTISEVFGHRINDTITYVCGNVAKTGGVVNPVIYIFFNKMVSKFDSNTSKFGLFVFSVMMKIKFM